MSDLTLPKAEELALFESIIADAITQNATHVHFSIREHTGHVQFRVNEALERYRWFPSVALRAVIDSAFELAEGDNLADSTNLASNFHAGYIPWHGLAGTGRSLRLRIASIPEMGGTDIVFHLEFSADAPDLPVA